jgi:AcrR family transcriptional regulator
VNLRERKRQRTHDAISAAAITLFLERGFDRVSVADVAAAAEVSKPTLFKYFANKEDLVLHRIADHRGESARIVRAGAGAPPLDLLQRHFLDGLDRRDPVTGLNDHPEVLAYHRLVFSTPSLALRVAGYIEADEEALADALTEAFESLTAASGAPHEPPPQRSGALGRRLVAAGQILATQRILARENWRKVTAGRPADEVYPEALVAADQAFDLLRYGLGAAPGHPDTGSASRPPAHG